MPIPASDWDLARAETKDGRVVLTPSNVDLCVKGGFKTGWIYEFIYDTVSAALYPEPRPQFGYTIVRSMMRRSSGR